MNHWEQAMLDALAERRRRIEALSKEIGDVEHQLALCQQAMLCLAGEKTAVEEELNLLERVAAAALAEQAHEGCALQEDPLPPNEDNTETSPMIGSRPPLSVGAPVDSARPKVAVLMEVLGQFGASGASPATLASACTSAGVPMKAQWASSYLSQKKKQGLVVGRGGLWWTMAFAPQQNHGDVAMTHTAPQRHSLGLMEATKLTLKVVGEKGGLPREMLPVIRQMRPQTTAEGLSSCLSKLCKKGKALRRDGRYSLTG